MATRNTTSKATKVVSFRFGEDKEFKVKLNFEESNGMLILDSSSKHFMDFLEHNGTNLVPQDSDFKSWVKDNKNVQVVLLPSDRKFRMFLIKAHRLGLKVIPGKSFHNNRIASIVRSEKVAERIRSHADNVS